jgi:hypothetical protein
LNKKDSSTNLPPHNFARPAVGMERMNEAEVPEQVSMTGPRHIHLLGSPDVEGRKNFQQWSCEDSARRAIPPNVVGDGLLDELDVPFQRRS